MIAAIGTGLRAAGSAFTPAHRLAVGCALLHLCICAVMAVVTGTLAIFVFVGIPAVVFPAWIALMHPHSLLSRVSMAIGFMSLTGLVIQQSGGDMEAHFSFFVMISILVVYNDWRPLAVAYAAIVAHHAGFTLLQPEVSGITGFHVWNDERNIWGHLAVHAVAAGFQTLALCYVAEMLRQRHVLEIENAALGRSLRHASERADRDALTGLFNRRHLAAWTERLAPLVDDGTAQAAVLVIDLDHFKLVNDRYGHAAGDDVLKSVAETIRLAIGHGDIAVRQGGEEFVVVMRDPPARGDLRLAEIIRATIAVRPVATEIGPISVTASVGVALWYGGEGFASALRRADRGLYVAKNRGRNCVERSAEPTADATMPAPREQAA